MRSPGLTDMQETRTVVKMQTLPIWFLFFLHYIGPSTLYDITVWLQPKIVMTSQDHLSSATAAAALHVGNTLKLCSIQGRFINHQKWFMITFGFLHNVNFSRRSPRVPAESCIINSFLSVCCYDFPSATSGQWNSELCLKATLPRTCSNMYIGLFVFEKMRQMHARTA